MTYSVREFEALTHERPIAEVLGLIGTAFIGALWAGFQNSAENHFHHITRLARRDPAANLDKGLQNLLLHGIDLRSLI